MIRKSKTLGYAAFIILPSTTFGYTSKQKRYAQIVGSTSYKFGRLLADTWCVAFVFPKTKEIDYPITERTYREIEQNPHNIAPGMQKEIQKLKGQYQFFHWHLEFPGVFRIPTEDESPENEQAGWSGGFDCVLGNPPWELKELKEQEWFAATRPDIAQARTGAIRKRMIAELASIDPSLFKDFAVEKRVIDSTRHLIRESGAYPHCGRGRINTYAVFAELKRAIVSSNGYVGCVIPSGIATDDTTKLFFQSLMDVGCLASLYSFENEEFIFPGVHHATKFCLLTMCGGQPGMKADFVFFARHVAHLAEKDFHFRLTAEDVRLLNPNTRTCPIFRSSKDADICKYVYKRIPVLIREGGPRNNVWGLQIRRIFNMGIPEVVEKCTGDPADRPSEFLPMYESKMIHQFDHRFGTYVGQTRAQANQGKLPELSNEQHRDPGLCAIPRFYMKRSEVGEKLNSLWDRGWLITWRDVTSSVVLRTAVSAVIPFAATDFTLRVGFPQGHERLAGVVLPANMNSYCFDYLVRQMLGGMHLSDYILKQLPVFEPEAYSQTAPWATQRLADWVHARALELTYSAWDVRSFAVDCGYDGPPFIWDEERRFGIRVELDAAYFHLYLGTKEYWEADGTKELIEYFPTPRDAVCYIMDSFRILRERDEANHGNYRTKEAILQIYDKMAEAIKTGQPYQTILDPPPGPPADENGNFLPLPKWLPGQPRPATWPPHIHAPKGTHLTTGLNSGEWNHG
ncbi:MAG: hypothetical protein JW720_13035 [Sedimentisphaerales bacterium]|nr:hypothetical protein [Sedimentisphaerales bacterium]